MSVAEVAVQKRATELLVPISARKQLNHLSDDMATKLSIFYYTDPKEALLKSAGRLIFPTQIPTLTLDRLSGAGHRGDGASTWMMDMTL